MPTRRRSTPMATPTTGTAICPYCAGSQERVMRGEHVVSGRLVTSHTELLRHRDESKDLQVDKRTGKLAADLEEDELDEAVVASVPAMRTIEVDRLQAKIPSGFRPIFNNL